MKVANLHHIKQQKLNLMQMCRLGRARTANPSAQDPLPPPSHSAPGPVRTGPAKTFGAEMLGWST